ncbi:hypothetical protein LZB85_09495, partial [Campylobacter jejuni]|uniref:hypothetical protein n=1 Tax=Campylobacter jejuni TaxID=197 RepID=UPI001F096A54
DDTSAISQSVNQNREQPSDNITTTQTESILDDNAKLEKATSDLQEKHQQPEQNEEKAAKFAILTPTNDNNNK